MPTQRLISVSPFLTQCIRPNLDADILIAGAGLAGLSLARELARRGYARQVLVVDARPDYERDQRWCTWGPVDASLERLSKHSWSSWQVVGDAGATRFETPARRYMEFHARDYFHAVLDELAACPTVQIRLDAPIEAVRNCQNWAEATIGGEVLRAAWLFDARNVEGERAGIDSGRSGEVWLWQSFVGWTVRTAGAFFDPDRFTLMDFRVPQNEFSEFFYVLPYSADCAFVECTVVDGVIHPPELYRDHLRWYLAERGITEWELQSEEIGAVPMTTHPFPSRARGAVLRIGVAGGGARPSTGYAFARIQRQVTAVADALLRGLPPQWPPDSPRRALLDAVLLDVIARRPGELRRAMLRMFGRLDGERIIRFLSEESTVADDIAIMAAVGNKHFAAAARKVMRGYCPKKDGSEVFHKCGVT